MIEYSDTTFSTRADYALRFMLLEDANRYLPERHEPHHPAVRTNSVRFSCAGATSLGSCRA